MAAANYYSKDFEWDQLRQEIENNPSLAHHLLPFPNSATQNQDTLLSSPVSLCSPPEDSEAWNKFHTRHSTGKFFKERRYLLKEFPELGSCGECSTVLEVGCGNGSTALPILRKAIILVHLLIENFNVLSEDSEPYYSDLIAETLLISLVETRASLCMPVTAAKRLLRGLKRILKLLI